MPKASRVDRILNVAVVVGLAIFAFWPDGSVYKSVSKWFETRETTERLTEAWPEILDSRARLGGSPGGPTLVVLTDYQCPFCQSMDAIVDSVLSINPTVGVVQLNFPLESIHPRAREAARLAVCLEGIGSLREAESILYRAYGAADSRDLSSLLPELSEDQDGLLRCVQAETTDARVTRDVELGLRLGLTGTPGFAVLGEGVHQGTTDVETMASWFR